MARQWYFVTFGRANSPGFDRPARNSLSQALPLRPERSRPVAPRYGAKTGGGVRRRADFPHGFGLRSSTTMNADKKVVINWLLEEDAPDEAIAYALAQAVYDIDDSSLALPFRLSQADKIRKNLRSLGFEIVHLPLN
jgi:hypothetical protein